MKTVLNKLSVEKLGMLRVVRLNVVEQYIRAIEKKSITPAATEQGLYDTLKLVSLVVQQIVVVSQNGINPH